MQQDVEITLTSKTGVLVQELELELEPIYTVQDILDYLSQNNLLQEPINQIEARKDDVVIAPHMRLHMLIGERAGERVKISLEKKGGSSYKGADPFASSGDGIVIPPEINAARRPGAFVPEPVSDFGKSRGNMPPPLGPPLTTNLGPPLMTGVGQGYNQPYRPPIEVPPSRNLPVPVVDISIDQSNGIDAPTIEPASFQPGKFGGTPVGRPGLQPPLDQTRNPGPPLGGPLGAPLGNPLGGGLPSPMPVPSFPQPMPNPMTAHQNFVGAAQIPDRQPVGGGVFGMVSNQHAYQEPYRSPPVTTVPQSQPATTYQQPYQQQYQQPPKEQEGTNSVEVVLIVEDPVSNKFELTIKANTNSSLENLKGKIIETINRSKRASEPWEQEEEIIIYWTPKLTARFKKLDRAFTDIPGLIKDGRVTFRLEKAYPGGQR